MPVESAWPLESGSLVRYAEADPFPWSTQRRTSPMAQHPIDPSRGVQSSSSSRRGFLQQAAVVTTGIAVLPAAAAAAERPAKGDALPALRSAPTA